MRFAVTCTIPVDVGNEFEQSPEKGKAFAEYLQKLKPEAAYFGGSRRSLLLILEAESQTELAEKMFNIWHTFKVYPEVEPVLNLEEFQALLPRLGELLKNL